MSQRTNWREMTAIEIAEVARRGGIGLAVAMERDFPSLSESHRAQMRSLGTRLVVLMFEAAEILRAHHGGVLPDADLRHARDVLSGIVQAAREELRPVPAPRRARR